MAEFGIFEIIIIFSVLYSLLSPLFKKKQQPPPGDAASQYPQHTDTRSQSSEEDAIRREIERLFGMESSKSENEYKREADVNYDQDSENYDRETVTSSRQQSPESVRQDYRSQEAERKNRELIEHQQEMMKKYDAIKNKKIEYGNLEEIRIDESGKLSERGVSIKNLLVSPSTLRDVILVSEIIGKPKALR